LFASSLPLLPFFLIYFSLHLIITLDSFCLALVRRSNHRHHLSLGFPPFSANHRANKHTMWAYSPPGSPVPDDLKPDLPYISGAVLKIQECSPPDPFGSSYEGPDPRTDHMRPWLQFDTASRFCLENPPLKCEPIANPKTLTVIIDSQIACGDGRGAQVVKCHSEDGKCQFAAKIFDPLYYEWRDIEDKTYLADHQFTTEAAAFTILSEMKDPGSFGYPQVREAVKGSIPNYYGSYTWETHLLDGQRRDVRLILMEYFLFPSMKSIVETGEVTKIPAETRMQLLARAKEIYCWLEYYGVKQNDFAMRNIMVDPDQGRVVLLDFSHAKIRHYYMSKWYIREGQSPPAGPTSPIEYFSCGWGDEMGDWIPENLRTAQARFDWFFNQWGNSTVFEPLGWMWEHNEPFVRAEIEEEKQWIERGSTDSSGS
jgi:hypothetical protein